MATALITGSGGLIGSESVRQFARAGFDVIGIENDMRSYFFGPTASTAHITRQLEAEHADAFRSVNLDIRDANGVDALVAAARADLAIVVHTAAQPSHDWAASEPHVDFGVNAVGTLNLLEAVRRHKPDATFVFCSTNKVYGDRPNQLPLVELETRLDLPEGHEYHGGVPVEMSIDLTLHSLFGASKASADLLVQEYGRYFGMPTVCFRAGCLTGPAHQGAQLHGFLAYLMRCVVSGTPYTVFGYGGKQVRDNIHARDVVRAFEEFHRSPRSAAVYNLGGGRDNSISVLEAIVACERIANAELDWSLSDNARVGDHRWWISDLDAFRADYPAWSIEHDLAQMLREIHAANADQAIRESA